MEDDLKIFKAKYLSNHWLDFTQILNSSLGDQLKLKITWNEDDLQWKTTSKYLKQNISATPDWILLKFLGCIPKISFVACLEVCGVVGGWEQI